MYPYTSNALDSYMIAQTSAGLALGAVLWHTPLRSRVATGVLLVATAMAVLAPLPVVRALYEAPFHPDRYLLFLQCSAAVATLAMAMTRPRALVVLALAGQLALWRASHWVRDADLELAGLYLAWIGVLVGLHRVARDLSGDARPDTPPTCGPGSSRWRDDLGISLAALVLGALAATFVLQRESGTGDEWANTYQADLFAHGHAFGAVPPCSRAFQNFWVFFYMGRSFSQYTPGWPLFMAPFQRVGLVWMAGPTMLAIGAVGVARVARRAVAAGVAGERHLNARMVRLSGWLAATLFTLGPSMLLNGGSRFPHPMICACFAWGVESAAVLLEPIPRDAARKQRWGFALGSAMALMLAARPGDGASIGPAIFLVFLYGLSRGRIGFRSFLGVALGFALFGGLTLVILRLQLGVWLKTGYQITEQFHPWAKLEFKAPEGHEVKHGLPLATGAYMWWPCAPVLGVAGLLATRGRARAVAFMLSLGTLGLSAFTSYTKFGQSPATAYGPRMHLPFVVAMAVGGAVLLTPILDTALRRVSMRRALQAGGPAAVALSAIVLGVVRNGPLIYPSFWAEMHKDVAPLRAIAAAHLHHAVVTVKQGETAFDPMDLLQNLPSDPDPEVLILHDEALPSLTCARERWADRTWYHVRGMDEATLTPW